MMGKRPIGRLKPIYAHTTEPLRRPVGHPRKYDIFLAGVGGLGVLTLARIVAEAGLRRGYDVKTCEFHGLAQRYGAIHAHVRFGKGIHSALIPEGHADLVIALEPLEALRAAYYASKEARTDFLVNTEKIYPITCFVEGHRYMPLDRIARKLKGFSRSVYALNASNIVKRETGRTITENIFLLGLASGLELLPLTKKNLLDAIANNIRKRFLEQNRKIFALGEKAAKTLR